MKLSLNTPDQLPKTPQPSRRAAFYVDGFNMYHALASLRTPYLKWLDWWSLANSIAVSRGETLVRVTFCTAPPKFKDESVQRRHTSYIQALSGRNVKVISGFFLEEPVDCRNCKRTWMQPQEKEGDVNLALSMIADAYDDVYDSAYLVTADSDQAPTMRHLLAKFSGALDVPKKAIVVVPPNMTCNRSLAATAGAGNIVLINNIMLQQNLLPKEVSFLTPAGTQRNVRRPTEYDPPERK